MKKLALLVALAAISVAAFAQNPAGNWKGKIQVDRAGLPPVQDPKQKEMMEKALATVEKMTLSLKMNANHTFTIVVPAMMGQPSQTSEGKWTQKGNVVTVITTKRMGKPVKNDKPRAMTLAPGGKTMVMQAVEGPNKAKITFTR